MPRTKKINEQVSQEEIKPTHQIISVPTLGDVSLFGNIGNYMNKSTESNSNDENTSNSSNLRTYIVFDYGDLVEDIPENSEKLDFYLNENKKQLDSYVEELNATVDDPNLLIFFHEGKQDRKYLSFESFYNQNGLAPKNKIINSWMDFYKNKYPYMSDEEIAIKVKGNLRYSFEIKV